MMSFQNNQSSIMCNLFLTYTNPWINITWQWISLNILFSKQFKIIIYKTSYINGSFMNDLRQGNLTYNVFGFITHNVFLLRKQMEDKKNFNVDIERTREQTLRHLINDADILIALLWMDFLKCNCIVYCCWNGCSVFKIIRQKNDQS